MRLGIDAAGEGRIAAPEPSGDGLTQRRDAADRRVLPNSLKMALSVGPRKGGISARGSPSERSIGGAPGSMPSSSAVRRAKGEATSSSREVSPVRSAMAKG